MALLCRTPAWVRAHRIVRLRQYRRLSTFKTAAGRVVTITKDIHPPSSNCKCDIQFPQGLEIDRDRPLINTVASYNQHIVIATGMNDWTSKIENEEGVGEMARVLKDMTKVKGEWFDPNYSTLISNSSFKPNDEPHGSSAPTSPGASNPPSEPSTSLKLFPHFLHFPQITSSAAHRSYLASNYLGDQTVRPNTIPDPPPDFAPPVPITKPAILICSHGSRDMRCGVLGPLLYHEFEEHNAYERWDVGMISHIGGHAFAGNVIIYIPPNYSSASDTDGEAWRGRQISPLAGMGIWYGRVEPGHVPTVIEETIRNGNIVGNLWRGGLEVGAVDMDGFGRKRYPAPAQKREDAWRERIASARTVRIPSGLLDQVQQDGGVVEELAGGEQVLSAQRRVELMGARARERWESRVW
ncbi:MAG: hypothetical protein Q9207_002147 [Kuettlingeria erythrocarpa]